MQPAWQAMDLFRAAWVLPALAAWLALGVALGADWSLALPTSLG